MKGKEGDPHPLTEEEYQAQFAAGPDACERLKAAYEEAASIRKFEIDLYWKRAAYFWAFIAIVFAGYFAVYNSTDGREEDLLFSVCCLGFVLTVAWYLVMRGSKFWQENWEKHVDSLEDAITGPLYETVLDPKEFKWYKIGPYPFSVTKINEMLSLYLATVWFFLALKSLSDLHSWWPNEPWHGFNSHCVGVISSIFVILFFFWGRTDLKSKEPSFIRRDLWKKSSNRRTEASSHPDDSNNA